MASDTIIAFECPKCKANLQLSESSPYIECEFCGLKLLRTDPIIQEQIKKDAKRRKIEALVKSLETRLNNAIESGDLVTQYRSYRVLSRLSENVHYQTMCTFWNILLGTEQLSLKFLSSLKSDDIDRMQITLKSLSPDCRLNNRPLASLALIKYLDIISAQLKYPRADIDTEEPRVTQSFDNRLTEIIASDISVGRAGGVGCVDSYKRGKCSPILVVELIILVAILIIGYFIPVSIDMLITWGIVGVLVMLFTLLMTSVLHRGDALWVSSCYLSGYQKANFLVFQDGIIFEYAYSKSSGSRYEYLTYDSIKGIANMGSTLCLNINNRSNVQVAFSNTEIEEIQRVHSYISARANV